MWYSYEDVLFEVYKDVVCKMLESNRGEVRKIVFEEDGFNNNDMIVEGILVSFDGIWFKSNLEFLWCL